MSDIHVLSGAYAVDALADDIERASFERHLAGCPSCRAEVESLREAAASLADDTSVVPPAELRASVLAGISKVRPLPPVLGPQAETESRTVTSHASARRRSWVPALVAAVVLALVGVGGVVWHPWRQDTSAVTTMADQVLGDPAAQRLTRALPSGGQATIVRSLKVHRTVIITDGVAPAPDGQVYQLWLQAPDKRFISAGLMPAGKDTYVLEGDSDDAITAGMSVEPTGGSDQPSDVVALFNFSKAA